MKFEIKKLMRYVSLIVLLLSGVAYGNANFAIGNYFDNGITAFCNGKQILFVDSYYVGNSTAKGVVACADPSRPDVCGFAPNTPNGQQVCSYYSQNGLLLGKATWNFVGMDKAHAYYAQAITLAGYSGFKAPQCSGGNYSDCYGFNLTPFPGIGVFFYGSSGHNK